jgi:DNA mismatch repair protein MutS
MAGVPSAVLLRATEILEDLERKSDAPRAAVTQTQTLQMTLFEVEESPVQKALQGLDVNRLTPMEALKMLDDWKQKWSK